MGTNVTPLHGWALESGASFQEWLGWELPQCYTGVKDEYLAATMAVALHDASYVGRIAARGSDALDLLNRLSTNEVVHLQPGQAAPTVLTNDRGRIVDLITVLNLGDMALVLTSPHTRETVVQWIDKYTIVDDVGLEDVTEGTCMLSLVGPGAWDLLAGLSNPELGSLEPYGCAKAVVAGAEAHILRRDLGSLPRYEVLLPSDGAEGVWRQASGLGAVPAGLEAWEVLRVQMGAPGYTSELGESYNPLETGLWGSISFSKGCYIGQEVIARLDTYQKVQKHLVSLEFPPQCVVVPGETLAKDGKEVGRVTSAATVPTTGKVIGLGYVRKEAAEAGTRMSLAKREDAWAEVQALVYPFGRQEAG